jgi:hypothetical protein
MARGGDATSRGCGRTGGGNFTGVATWAQSMGELGEDGPDWWSSAVTDDDAVTGGRPAHALR